VICF